MSSVKVIGGRTRYASNTILQYNGYGTVTIDGFYAKADDSLLCSYGTCGNIVRLFSDIYTVIPKMMTATVKQNWNDQATPSNIKMNTGKTVCMCGSVGSGFHER